MSIEHVILGSSPVSCSVLGSVVVCDWIPGTAELMAFIFPKVIRALRKWKTGISRNKKYTFDILTVQAIRCDGSWQKYRVNLTPRKINSPEPGPSTLYEYTRCDPGPCRLLGVYHPQKIEEGVTILEETRLDQAKYLFSKKKIT